MLATITSAPNTTSTLVQSGLRRLRFFGGPPAVDGFPGGVLPGGVLPGGVVPAGALPGGVLLSRTDALPLGDGLPT